ncbi:type IV pilus modification PilV family protein [Alkalicoccobacillus plakortidis]|uniref:Type II secretion system GspH family protein n=1 Tax=Alkalicoccobacillus plakortidis TaxID=444060 RepID=A0ABT0XH16_9BACI|nr:type II secretion system protein [Alkalicoccobacillus plakortidis]MCM2675184.1 type II secretion system GspH family protein [Alkalicoccobacillus plakortidis]
MHRNEHGLTLIELLASMVILSIFAIGFATMLMNGIKANEINRIEMEATLVAQSEIESMRLNQDAAFCTASEKPVESFLTKRTVKQENGMCLISVEVTNDKIPGSAIKLDTEISIPKAVTTP